MIHEITILCVKRSATIADLVLVEAIGQLDRAVKIDTETVKIVIVMTQAPADFYNMLEHNGATNAVAIFTSSEEAARGL